MKVSLKNENTNSITCNPFYIENLENTIHEDIHEITNQLNK
jgi:hypothetical protein